MLVRKSARFRPDDLYLATRTNAHAGRADCRRGEKATYPGHFLFGDHPVRVNTTGPRKRPGSGSVSDTWLSHRCHIAKGEERVALFGPCGLTEPWGVAEYARPRRFRARLEHLQGLVNPMWPECPAHINADGKWLPFRPASSIRRRM